MATVIDNLKIVRYPHPVLREVARPVPEINDQVRAVAVRMLELMHRAPGVGLAAPQVGLAWRMFVANDTGEPEDDRVFVNPRLSDPSEATEPAEEGCLSLPDIRGDITRPVQITITATDLDGRTFTATDDGLAARIWQHEYDHLEGVLILDRMTRLDRLANRKRVQALEIGY